ncbi:MAG TPA: hypothetical protein DEA96_02690 [Leptospiraceae bacterium]|nr:hypothetical protein [Spirochaetaceae bacterium]HBS03844.1 hypothetical protein [Leptospiraceae bacterium]|tara:strand:- start:137855 stop:138361 length:507 start_codon:yes stop_codon:yes gene_type:complete
MEKESLELRRKWVFRCRSRKLHLIKKPLESSEHVFLKAFVWSLYLDQYPNLMVERSIGDRYKPDVVALDESNLRPVFWAEAGQVKPQKIESILRRFEDLHFVIARWGFRKEPLVDLLQKRFVMDTRIQKSSSRIELLQMDSSAHLNCIHEGNIQLSHEFYRLIPVWPT